MTIQQLLEPIIEGGIHSTNFFNGRRLTAEDLLREKKSNREHERLLGQAIGEGVVHGLEVGFPDGLKTGGSKIEIQKGLAINRKGDVLYLPNKIPVPLVPPVEEVDIQASFANCEKLATEYPSTNHGVYVLLIAPASGLSGSAPMSSIPDDGSIIGCGKSDSVEGVQFRLVKMDLDGPAFQELKAETKAKLDEVAKKTDMASVSMFRNIVAHACFGTEEKEKFIVDPFGSNDFSSYGAIDKLRSLDDDAPNKITDCDVPIAIIRWTEQKIQFVDLWSVRRKPYEIVPSSHWPTLMSSRRQAEAMFLQFHDHLLRLIEDAETSSAAASISAKDYFAYLPPAGFIQLAETDRRGVNYNHFFENITLKDPKDSAIDAGAGPVFLEGARISLLIHDSLGYQPVDLYSGIFLWLYRIRENFPLGITSPSEQGPQSFILFASGYMPYYATPRFDLSRWDRSNYSSVLLGPG